MKGRGISFGAVSVVNAIATGKGAALGVDLRCEAEVEMVEGSTDIEVEIIGGDADEDESLAQHIVTDVLARFGKTGYGAKVVTKSEIPIGRGLKSSSAASNAMVLATLAALRAELDDMSIINMGIDASLKAGVTITGAFDDACASFFGGLVVTDNVKRKILKRVEVGKDYTVVIYVPQKKMYTRHVDEVKLRALSPLLEEAHTLALRGEYWRALTLNGLACSSALGFDTKPTIDALSNGAIAAGLSGTGPAIAAVVPREGADRVVAEWADLPGDVIRTEINHEKARMVY